MVLVTTNELHDKDRTEAFRRYASQRAAGEVTVPPHLLPREERRLHIRRTLREDHQFRIANRPEGAQRKFDELADSLMSFFRGTALLYYRDYAGEDSELPQVFTVGDVHPENFGVMPNRDGAPFFGVNDFDEAHFAPFSYDVKRGAVGFYLVAQEAGMKKKKCKAVVRAFVHGYVEGLMEFARSDREKWHQYRIDNSPKMIRNLLENSLGPRGKFLEKWVDLEHQRFIPSEKIVPYSQSIDQFEKAVKRYVRQNKIKTPHKRKSFFKVHDVAIKKDSGTASLGLDRFFVLIDGSSDDADDDVILEFKQTRRSALFGLVPDTETDEQGEADVDDGENHAVQAHDVHLVGGDPFYGRVEIDGTSYLVRERSPYKDEIDADDLDEEEMLTYANICGHVLAQTHARSDEDSGVMQGNAEAHILTAIEPAVFEDDVVRFAHTAVKRIRRDYKLFRKDHALGAFNFVSDSAG